MTYEMAMSCQSHSCFSSVYPIAKITGWLLRVCDALNGGWFVGRGRSPKQTQLTQHAAVAPCRSGRFNVPLLSTAPRSRVYNQTRLFHTNTRAEAPDLAFYSSCGPKVNALATDDDVQ